jgi:methyl-accepting chemotaxis protein
MRLSDYRINTRIYAGFGSLIAITAVLAAFGMFQLRAINGHVDKFVGVAGNTTRNLTVQRIAARLRRLALQFQATEDRSAVDKFAADQVQALDLLAAAAKATISDDRRRLYGEASATISSVKHDFDELVMLGSKTADARAKLFTGGDELTAATDKLVAAAREQSEVSVKAQAIDVETAVLKVRIANWRFLATRDPKGPATFAAAADKARSALSTLDKNAAASGLKALLAPVRASLDAYAANFAVVSDSILRGAALYEKTMALKFEKISADGDAAQKTLDIDLAATRTNAEQTISSTMSLQALLAGIAIVLGCALAFLIGRSIARPISAMTSAMNRLAGGDKSIAIPAHQNKDEIGEMAKAVDVFKQNMIKADSLTAEQQGEQARKEARQKAIDTYIGEFDRSVREALGALASAATEMRATATSMSATAEQTQHQASTVAAASEQTSANVQTVAASAEEMSSSITEISRQVTQASRIAAEAVADAQRTNATVNMLAEAAQKIGQVVQLIQDIAGQTNLLALNATIEAARAGDAGKGFAVVASEVKSLATQTAKATEEIAGQIGSIQSVTGQAVTAIQGIGGTIERISEISTAIASAIEEQGAATKEIAHNTQQAAKGTEQVSSIIGSVNQAASETGSAATNVLSSAEALGRQSETLRNEVGRFLEKMRAA